MPTPEEAVWAPGPWNHRDIAANGVRFHAVEMGSGPLILLLHSFPQYWWTWRLLLPELAAAGYHAVAIDLRGYGGSDHTPHGYDPFTLSADAAGIIRSLGHSDAVIIGHGWGGLIAWSAAVLRRQVVRAIAPVTMPHPNMLRRAFVSDPQQRKLSRYAIGYQVPFRPERKLLRDEAAEIAVILQRWSGSNVWPDTETAEQYRAAMQFGATAHCALEYYRWAVRSIPRPDGRRFAEQMTAPVSQPVLQLLGRNDGSLLRRSFDGSEDFVTGRYERYEMSGVGHFPQEESPMEFNQIVLRWLNSL